MEADSHVAVQPSEPFNTQEVVTIPADLLPLLPWDPRQGPGVEGLPAVRGPVQARGASRQPGHQAQDQDGPQGRQRAHPGSGSESSLPAFAFPMKREEEEEEAAARQRVACGSCAHSQTDRRTELSVRATLICMDALQPCLYIYTCRHITSQPHT